MLDDLGELRAVEIEAELLRLQHERRLARRAPTRRSGCRCRPTSGATCSYASGRLAIALDVQPGLVRERRVADVRRLRVERHVHELGDVVRDRREPLEAVGGIVSMPIFSVRFGMIVVRLQLPVRSP